MPKLFRKLSYLCVLILTLGQALAISAQGKDFSLPELPPLAVLEDAALKHAGLDPQVLGRWQRKSRLAPALPRLQVGYDQKAVQQNTAINQDSISVTSAGVAIGP